MHHNASTQLWLGSREQVLGQIYKLVQHHYCPHAGCGACSICKQIAQKQFFALLCTATEKASYTRADLETIFDKIALQAADDQPFFCVIEQADKLTAATANNLLKVLEEPPHNWHWILQTERIQDIMPTVRSRCLVRQFETAQLHTDYRELLAQLTGHFPRAASAVWAIA